MADLAQINLPAVVDATWPAATYHRAGPWLVREGRGGGKRVSAATAEAPVVPADIAQAEAMQADLGQQPLFMLRPGEETLDAELQARGYEVVDPVVGYAVPVSTLAPPPPMSAFFLWPPLAMQRDLWAESGIGPGRLAVMDRVEGPKCAIMSRVQDRASGVAFVAIHDRVAMMHALEILPAWRRQGSANHILRAAAAWAQDNGADWLTLVVTEANAGARALYASLNMQIVGHYHYRAKVL